MRGFGRRLTLLLVVLLRSTYAMGQGYAPDESVARMTLPAGFEVQLVAAEPRVRQPVDMTFDARGRLWVVQYLQYPNPAGLKRVSVDRYSRTIYDRVPEPPPRGPRGADRITILEDTDGDGVFDAAKDFVDGLNLCSGALPGYGGVFVLQTPYLLFYPDRDGDDVPDGDPEVLLSGFGMEDAHAVANSLCWGPDGWLYGAQGSTVTANIRGIRFQQGVWRYHPRTREFELFAEGGGNTWGLDFDADGQLLVSTNYGGYALLHQVQGAYYVKSFGKHGELHNPYAFGYFEHVPYEDFRGGHVTSGGIVYQGHTFPAFLQGRYIAANLLSHAVHWHELDRRGSTFTARHGGVLLDAHDTWFAPVDVELGPDGAIYVADWHDQRTAHPDPDAEWDRTNGRIYRIAARGTPGVERFDLQGLSSGELVELLRHPNAWQRRQARQMLAERQDAEVASLLREQALHGDDHRLALESLWALYVSGGLDEGTSLSLLDHPDEAIRTWVVRLAGDRRRLGSRMAQRVEELAATDDSPMVRCQLACTAQRLESDEAIPLVAALIARNEDTGDPKMPLLLWWAIERRADEHDALLQLTGDDRFWQSDLARQHLVDRLARRWVAAGEATDWRACATLVRSAPDERAAHLVLRGVAEAMRGRSFEEPPPELGEFVLGRWRAEPNDPVLSMLAIRFGERAAREAELERLADGNAADAERLRAVNLLSETARSAELQRQLLAIVQEPGSAALCTAAIEALGRFDDPAVAAALLDTYPRLTAPLQGAVVRILCSRSAWAGLLLDAVDKGVVGVATILPEHLQKMALHGDARLDARILSRWGRITPATPEEKLATVRRLNNDLRAASGDASTGRLLFREHCGTCHRLFGEGKELGPDLTSANRHDRHALLVNIVDPSAQVRREYLGHTVQLTDGRVLTGLIVEQTPGGMTLVDVEERRYEIATGEIDALEPSPQSLMPEGLLDKLSPQQLRDLFAYLESDEPPAGKR